MTISVLACKADGTQVLEEREVSETYFQMTEEDPSAETSNHSEE